jgi:hypothetical protein
MLASVLLYDVALQLLSNLLCVMAAIENQRRLLIINHYVTIGDAPMKKTSNRL